MMMLNIYDSGNYKLFPAVLLVCFSRGLNVISENLEDDGTIAHTGGMVLSVGR